MTTHNVRRTALWLCTVFAAYMPLAHGGWDPDGALNEPGFEVVGGPAGGSAPNPAQGFRTYFEPGGIRVEPLAHAAEPWRWSLALRATGRAAVLRAAAPAGPDILGARVEYARPGLTEWFVNRAEGLKHGFTFDARPGGAGPEVVLDLALGGTLHPRFAADGSAVEFALPAGGAALRYAELIVVDAHGRVLPSRIVGIAMGDGPGLRLAFDDGDAVYPVTVDPLLTSHSWSAESDQVAAWFGQSVATAGDVNGDGYSDVVVGAPFYDKGESDEGRVLVYLGSAAGLQTSPAWAAESNQANSYFGWSVASAGDVNADGFADVVVGAYSYTNGQDTEGRAFLYLGSSSGLATAPAWTAESNVSGAWFGYAVAGAGDVNGDGFADVVVGAPYYFSGTVGGGAAYVYHGSASGLSASPARLLEIRRDGSAFGIAVATAGDVNADGFADVIVGADSYDNPQFNEGAMFVYLGSSSGIGASPAWSAEGNQAGAAFGQSVSTAGDVDGDGYADVIVGAPQHDGAASNTGRAYLYYGSATGDLSLRSPWTFEISEAGARLGQSVATAGDTNGDGYADLLIGAPFADPLAAVDVGAAYAFLGGPLIKASPGWQSGQSSFQFGAEHGAAVATAGDVNGDGHSDAIVGAPKFDFGQTDEGRTVLYLGSSSGMAQQPQILNSPRPQLDALFGFSAAFAGDVNGDGRSDVIVGAPYFDNGQFFEGEVCVFLAGQPPAAAWCVESNRQSALLGDLVGAAGDVNGDGYDDVLVGDRAENVFVYHGSATGLPAAPSWQVALPATDATGVGDVDADGFADVLLADERHADDTGRILLYRGSPGGLATEPAWVQAGSATDALFGRSIAAAGDVNRDGYSDFIVGSPGHVAFGSALGRAIVYAGSATLPFEHWSSLGDFHRAEFGNSVTGAGDVNGDGFDDFAVGQPWYDAPLSSRDGRVFVYHGAAPSPGPEPALVIGGLDDDTQLGGELAGAGDTDADGYSDLLVATLSGRGRAYLLRGSAAGLVPVVSWANLPPRNGSFASSVDGAGDWNGDGFSDLLVGAPTAIPPESTSGGAYLYLGGQQDGPTLRFHDARQLRVESSAPIARLGESDAVNAFRLSTRGGTAAGRGWVRLEREAKPPSAAFDGTGLERSAPTDTGPAVARNATFLETVTPGVGEAWRWRARIVSADPLFPRTPWFTIPARGWTEIKLRLAFCADRDGDGRGGPGDPLCASTGADCHDGDAAIWSAPGEARELVFETRQRLAWAAPLDPGATSVVYDVLRSGAAYDFTGAATCIDPDGGDTSAMDLALPPAGGVFFYLARAQNACPSGAGALGTRSDGSSRSGRACP